MQSRELNWTESGLITPPDSTISLSDSHCQVEQGAQTTDTTDESQLINSITTNKVSPDGHGSTGLLAATDICVAIKDGASLTSVQPSACVGYLDSHSQEAFRHSFYTSHAEFSNCREVGAFVSLVEILKRPLESTFTIVDQLNLARKIVLAVLNFHATSWIQETISLRDLSYYSLGQDTTGCLRTLHLGVDIFQGQPPDDLTPPMEGADDTQTIDTLRETYGVRNLTLWNLGVILLQIGRWSTIEKSDDVVTVRRLSDQVPMLGHKYRNITKQCLECDFGFGPDLSKSRLQHAVYGSVACALSDMIKGLSLMDDSA